MLVSCKQLINEGFGMQLPGAIALERKRGLAAALGMDITAMERRRHEAHIDQSSCDLHIGSIECCMERAVRACEFVTTTSLDSCCR
jgi:hypothetical protein